MVYKNTSTSFFSKLFRLDYLEKVDVLEDSFLLYFSKSKAKKILYQDVRRLSVDFYFDKKSAYHLVTIVTKQNESYELELENKKVQTKQFFQAFSNFQLQRLSIPDSLEEIDLLLVDSYIPLKKSEHTVRLKNATIIDSQQGREEIYLWEELEGFHIDSGMKRINLKFKHKKMYYCLYFNTLTNLLLIVDILEKFSTYKSFIL